MRVTKNRLDHLMSSNHEEEPQREKRGKGMESRCEANVAEGERGPRLAAIALVTPTLAASPPLFSLSLSFRFNQVLNTSIVAHLENILTTFRGRYQKRCFSRFIYSISLVLFSHLSLLAGTLQSCDRRCKTIKWKVARRSKAWSIRQEARINRLLIDEKWNFQRILERPVTRLRTNGKETKTGSKL